MKKILTTFIVLVVVKIMSAQQSYFTCDEISVYLNKGSATINLPNLSKEEIKQKIQSLIKERNYVYKPYYSNESLVSFRDFARICDKSKCGSDMIAKTIFHLACNAGFVKITLDYEIYSSFYGAELLINDNDDVASKNDVPFAPYEFQIWDKYADEYPESIYVFNKKGKTKVKNGEVQKTILNFFNRYITDIKSYLEN